MTSLIIHPSSKGLYRLTIVEIMYYLPDYRDLLQTYTWQDYDYVPELPKLKEFLKFWHQEIEAELHSLKISSQIDFDLSNFTYSKLI